MSGPGTTPRDGLSITSPSGVVASFRGALRSFAGTVVPTEVPAFSYCSCYFLGKLLDFFIVSVVFYAIAMPRLYQSQAGWNYLRRRATHSGYIRKRRMAQAAGLHGRRMSALMAARAYPIARPMQPALRGFLGGAGENKYVDVANAVYVCDTTGSITHISVVAQGDSVNQRDGRKFMPTWVNMRGIIANGSTATSTESAVLLVWDKQPNKALAAITDILDVVSTVAQNKRENSSRFMIIRRWSVLLTGKSDGSTVPGFARNFDRYVRLPRGLVAECTPSDTTGEIGNRVTGALLLVTLGNRAAGTAAAALETSIRIGFKDV